MSRIQIQDLPYVTDDNGDAQGGGGGALVGAATVVTLIGLGIGATIAGAAVNPATPISNSGTAMGSHLLVQGGVTIAHTFTGTNP